MPRHVFYSFHYQADSVRASKVRNMGVVDGNVPAYDNDWESIKKEGERAIKKWIDNQLHGRSCTVVLVGEHTADRKWVRYEIEKSWNDGKGLVGIHIHRLTDFNDECCLKGENPFSGFTMSRDKSSLDQLVRTYDPPYWTSKDVYAYIRQNLPNWVDEACEIRRNW